MKLRVFILLFFVAGASFAQTSFSKFKNQPITVDGIPNEWFSPLRFYNNETKLFFAFVNDSSNLYLCFQSNDERNQVKINRAGMQVGISVKTKTKKNVSVDFPLTDSKSRFTEEDIDGDKRPDITHLKNTFLVQNTNMAIKGFTTKDAVIPISGDSSGIVAALNWDKNNVMTYELLIPFKQLFGEKYTPEDLSKVITLNVEVNAVTRTDESSLDGSNAAMGAAGMGQTRGMTGGIPGGGGGSKERKPMFDKNIFKQKFTLTFTK